MRIIIKNFLRKAEEAGRLPDIEGLSTPELLEKLRLAKNGQLKRVAIILFGKDPGAFYPNTFVKISKFETDDFTIRFQELEEGNLIQIIDKVLRTIDYKFLIRNITFEGMNRVETLKYPVPTLREMLLNDVYPTSLLCWFTECCRILWCTLQQPQVFPVIIQHPTMRDQ